MDNSCCRSGDRPSKQKTFIEGIRMKRALVAMLLVLLSCAASNASDKRPPAAADLVGNWEGTSICQVKPSPCHDEHVILRLSHPQRDKINVQADKIVDSK